MDDAVIPPVQGHALGTLRLGEFRLLRGEERGGCGTHQGAAERAMGSQC